jgi:hypothetical protein
MKLASIISLIILSLIITVSCKSNKPKPDSKLPVVEEKRETAMIAQGQFFEECIELYPNQVLHYSFNSSQDVNFNIHYHGMEGRQYAIKKNNITSYSGELVCNEMDFYDTDQENFCMIWSNLNEVDARVSLKYHITTRTPPSP